MDNGQVNFAKNAKLLRKKMGFTQATLAEASGLALQTIKELETGRTGGSVQTFMSIARALNMSIEEILRFNQPPSDGKARLNAAMADDIGLDYQLLQKISSLGEKEMSILKTTVDTLYQLSQQNQVPDLKKAKA